MMQAEDELFCIKVTNACKRYGKGDFVLRGLHMCIPNGIIYSLLGASGCGKTTLLHCIAGLLTLDSGSVESTFKYKSQLGYMPQEIALHSLNIGEIFDYYGVIHKMDKKLIQRRLNEFTKLFDLPPSEAMCLEISGGEQRRVSLAIAMLHDPSLLILDEPTVGVDPVLRESIWEYLISLSNEGQKTIIITTHYIEETKRASRIGFMREGKLLCEQRPLTLLETFNTDSLEEVFLKLSENQETERNTNQNESNLVVSSSSSEISPLGRVDTLFASHRCIAELKKNYLFLKRNKSMVVYLVVLLFVLAAAFNLSIGQDPKNLSIGIVNRDYNSSISQCSQVKNVIEAFNDTCTVQYLSCKFITRLEHLSLKLILYPDLESGMKDIERNSIWSLLYFSHNYTDSLIERIDFGRYVDPNAIDYGIIDVYIDRSNYIISRFLERNLIDTMVKSLKEILKECDWNVNAGKGIVNIKTPILGSNVLSFTHFTAPAVVLLIMFTQTQAYTGFASLEEKLSKAAERSFASGVSMLEMMSAHFLVGFIILIPQTIVVVYTTYFLFDNPFYQPFLSTALIFLSGISGLIFGFVLSVSFDDISAAVAATSAHNFTICFLGGLFWPLEGMPAALRLLSCTLLPTTMGVQSLRSLSSRAWNLTNPSVFSGFLTILAWICIYIIVIILTVRYKVYKK